MDDANHNDMNCYVYIDHSDPKEKEVFRCHAKKKFEADDQFEMALGKRPETCPQIGFRIFFCKAAFSS